MVAIQPRPTLQKDSKVLAAVNVLCFVQSYCLGQLMTAKVSYNSSERMTWNRVTL